MAVPNVGPWRMACRPRPYPHTGAVVVHEVAALAHEVRGDVVEGRPLVARGRGMGSDGW